MSPRVRLVLMLVMAFTVGHALIACIRHVIWRVAVGELVLEVTIGIVPSVYFAILMSGDEK